MCISLNDVRRCFNLQKIDKGECWIWPIKSGLNRSKYGQLTIRKMGVRYRILAHRASYMIHKGPIPKGVQVMHECDVRRCVNPKHLTLGTNLDNSKDKVRKGRQSKGDHRWSATLTNKQAQSLLDRYRKGEAIGELADKFRVTYGVAYSIAKRTRWKNALT